MTSLNLYIHDHSHHNRGWGYWGKRNCSCDEAILLGFGLGKEGGEILEAFPCLPNFFPHGETVEKFPQALRQFSPSYLSLNMVSRKKIGQRECPQ